jgi:protein-tyrosine-phosphatase
MAAALLRARLVAHGEATAVHSAGFVSEGVPAPSEAVEVMRAIGIDLSDHRSRLVRPGMLATSTLVIGMTRQHAVDAVTMLPSVWSRCFTVAELLARGEAIGARRSGETISDWVARVNAGRTPSGTISLPLADDVPDPLGKRPRAFRRIRDQLATFTDRLALLIVSA